MHYVFLIKKKIQYQCIYLGTSEKKNRPSKKKLFKETYSQVSETQVGRPLDIKPCVSQLFQLFILDFVCVFLDDGLLPSLRTIDLVFSNFVITINSCARS